MSPNSVLINKCLLYGCLILKFFDVYTTYILIEAFGISSEANPILRTQMQYYGGLNALLMSFFITLFGMIFLYYYANKHKVARTSLIVCFCMFLAVVINNFMAIFG